MGAWNHLQTMEGLEAFVNHTFSKQLGYSHADIEKLCKDLRAELKDPKVQAMYYMSVTQLSKLWP